MDWLPVIQWLQSMAPWVQYLIMGLGFMVVLGTFIDNLTTDKGAFMTKVMNIPVLGTFLDALAKFSPFNANTKK